MRWHSTSAQDNDRQSSSTCDRPSGTRPSHRDVGGAVRPLLIASFSALPRRPRNLLSAISSCADVLSLSPRSRGASAHCGNCGVCPRNVADAGSRKYATLASAPAAGVADVRPRHPHFSSSPSNAPTAPPRCSGEGRSPNRGIGATEPGDVTYVDVAIRNRDI
jgi:hypothetical protein